MYYFTLRVTAQVYINNIDPIENVKAVFLMTFTCHFYSGLVLRWNLWRPTQRNKCFDDQAFWEVRLYYVRLH